MNRGVITFRNRSRIKFPSLDSDRCELVPQFWGFCDLGQVIWLGWATAAHRFCIGHDYSVQYLTSRVVSQTWVPFLFFSPSLSYALQSHLDGNDKMIYLRIKCQNAFNSCTSHCCFSPWLWYLSFFSWKWIWVCFFFLFLDHFIEVWLKSKKLYMFNKYSSEFGDKDIYTHETILTIKALSISSESFLPPPLLVLLLLFLSSIRTHRTIYPLSTF